MEYFVQKKDILDIVRKHHSHFVVASKLNLTNGEAFKALWNMFEEGLLVARTDVKCYECNNVITNIEIPRELVFIDDNTNFFSKDDFDEECPFCGQPIDDVTIKGIKETQNAFFFIKEEKNDS